MKNKSSIRLVLASNIRRFRKDRKLTQEKLAELADISNTYIANIECGKTWVSDNTLEKIADALDIPVYEFFIPEKDLEIELKKIPKSTINKIFSAKEKTLKSEISSLIENTIRKTKEEFTRTGI